MPPARAKHCKREKSVTVVEYGCGSDNLVSIIVDETAKVSHVPVSVENYGIKEEYVRKPRVGQSLVPRYDTPRRHIAVPIALRLDPFKPQKLPISMP